MARLRDWRRGKREFGSLVAQHRGSACQLKILASVESTLPSQWSFWDRLHSQIGEKINAIWAMHA